jgi:RHS repeat-associated protein
MRRLLLRTFQSPGDVLMLTAAVRDLHAAAPRQFVTDVRTSCPALWENNPHLSPLREGESGVEIIDMHYPLIHQSNQPTQFLYGSTLAASGIASSLLKVAEVYPDSVGGSDQVSFAYNRHGEVITLTDQNGTVHSYDYDLLGRRTQDRVSTLGSGVDGAVRRIATTYEARGMVSGVTSYDNATVGSGNVVNDVLLEFDNFGNLSADYQEHAGAVNTSTTPVCQYGYANGPANTVRLLSLTYPNGRVLNYDYGSSGGMNDALSRVASLIDNDGTTHLGDYSYLGLAAIVEVTSVEPGLKYTLVGIVGGNDPDTGDIYRGLDRFGRVKDLLWYNTGSLATVERVQHGYDRAGNRTWRAELADVLRLHDELYGYDGLDRLKTLDRGSLNGTETALTAKTFAQCWSLDPTGNWMGFQQDSTGSGWDLIQSRTANRVNEITVVSNSVGAVWAQPGYDPAGNMTTVPQPGAVNQSYTAVYDAWNRLVLLSAGGSTVAAYEYDGLKRRTVKQRYTAGVLSETRHLFYSAAWQVLEERVGTASTAERQFVCGLRYIDDLVLRDRDVLGLGTLSERFYAIQDPNWNLTGVANSAGIVQERYGYDAYGVPAVMTAAFLVQGASLYDWETRFGGYRWDGESGLYQVRHRGFHAILGCWGQRDVLGAAGTNLYKYVMGRPVSATDATGLLDPGTGLGTTAAVAGGGLGVATAGVAGAGAAVGVGYIWLGVELFRYAGILGEEEKLDAALRASRAALAAKAAKATKDIVDIECKPRRLSRKRKWYCKCKVRGSNIPPDCQSFYYGSGETEADAKRDATQSAAAEGCHKPPKGYNCGHHQCQQRPFGN